MIVQPTKENLGFDSPESSLRGILDRLSYSFLGGLVVSGLFLFMHEIPNSVFVFLMFALMMVIDLYLISTSANDQDGDDQ